MRKSNLVDRVAAATRQSAKDSKKAVDAVFSAIEQSFVTGRNVNIRLFGCFEVKERKRWQGRNPKTGRVFNVPAKRVRAFQPSKELTARVNVPAFPQSVVLGIDSLI